MKDFRNIIFILIIAVFILQLIVMKQDAKIQNEASNKPLVSLSTFSLYDITKHIAGDTVELVMILPFGVDAHSFEPTPKLLAKISKSKLVVYSGAGLEPWIDGFEFNAKSIDMSKHVNLRELKSDEFDHHSFHDKQCVHNTVDPHYWLDINNMKIATEIITQELIKISPKDSDLYIKNSQKYINMLEQLDEAFKTQLSQCNIKSIVVNHNAFSYLSNRYNFKVKALSGLSPDAQPSAKNMTKLIEYVKSNHISTIFFESFVSDRAIKSIANEAKISVDVLQPLGNITADEANKNLDYKSIMLQNLQKISKALECR